MNIATIIAFVFLIVCIGFFSSSETAYLSLTKIKIRELLQNAVPGAKRVEKLYNNIDSLITLVLIGTNCANTFAAAIATAEAIRLVGAGGVGIATVTVAFLVTTFGQIIPKTYAVGHPVSTARAAAPVLAILQKILFPVVWLFTNIARGIAHIVDALWHDDEQGITTAELQALFAVGATEGTIEKNEMRMLNKVFQFSDLDVHDIMKHHSLIPTIYDTDDRETAVHLFLSAPDDRLPVYKQETETVVGVLDYKSVLFQNTPVAAASEGFVRQCMQPAVFVPETFTVFELLTHFRRERSDFAVVLDEHGVFSGTVTMSDVTRVVFGRITDDAADATPESRVQVTGINEFLVPGDIQLTDINDFFKLNVSSEYFNTLGGWLLEQFGSLPSVGELCIYNGTIFIVEAQAQRRILTVRMKLKST
ncbi:MAG: HlyC/CorC family transporter [Treponema sp.]|nr:HlyC/CorC family transporter [Treponema sp.]